MIVKDPRLDSLFQILDVEKKWETLIETYNDIINTLSPPKMIQIKDDNVPFMTDEIEEDLSNLNEQLTKAICSKNIEEWRLYRSMRNVLYKSIEATKTIFYVNLFKRSKQMGNKVKKTQ